MYGIMCMVHDMVVVVSFCCNGRYIASILVIWVQWSVVCYGLDKNLNKFGELGICYLLLFVVLFFVTGESKISAVVAENANFSD